MNHLEKIKFWLGIVLISFAVIGGIIFFIEMFFHSSNSSLAFGYTSSRKGILLVALNTPIFFGLCAIAGAWLIISVKKTDL
tara:strand:+ start:181 stop:423 length:243 start_codon:yes stop_codon:yes gene_type:complete